MFLTENKNVALSTYPGRNNLNKVIFTFKASVRYQKLSGPLELASGRNKSWFKLGISYDKLVVDWTKMYLLSRGYLKHISTTINCIILQCRTAVIAPASRTVGRGLESPTGCKA
jgi:hypothetical protein